MFTFSLSGERSILRPAASSSVLTGHFYCWRAICIKKRVMPKIESQEQDASVEPAPRFPSDAEVALAEQLRHQLEERLLGPSAAPPPLLKQPDEDTDSSN